MLLLKSILKGFFSATKQLLFEMNKKRINNNITEQIELSLNNYIQEITLKMPSYMTEYIKLCDIMCLCMQVFTECLCVLWRYIAF